MTPFGHERRARRVVLAVVLVLSAGGFALASHAERSKENAAGLAVLGPEGSAAREAAERAAPSTTTTIAIAASTAPSTTPSTTAPEGSPEREAAERAARAGTTVPPTTSPPATTVPSTSSTTASPTTTVAPAHRAVAETLFGVRTESTATTTIVVVALLAGALVALVAQRRWMFFAVAAVALALAVLDAREALHQHDEGRTSLVVAAVALALDHLAASALGLITAQPAGRRRPS